jgi:hypothetical protein
LQFDAKKATIDAKYASITFGCSDAWVTSARAGVTPDRPGEGNNTSFI